MTVTIDLGPELEAELHDEAAKEGLDADSFILDTLRTRLRHSRHDVPHLSGHESALFETINFRWPPETQRRFERLVSRRRANKISPEELAELITLTDESERQAANRVGAVGELARLRGLPFEEVWHQLETNR